MNNARDFIIFSGTANTSLAEEIARELNVRLGECSVGRFPDGEVGVQLLQPVRRKEVLLVQPLSPPVNEHLIELLALADACRRAAAGHITAIVPYFGYARADKRHGRREPVTARLVADLLETVGIGHVVTVDLHAAQIEGFFHIPVDSLTAVPTICQALRESMPSDFVVVSPDVGRVPTATHYAQNFGVPVIVLHKRRESGSETEVTHVVGEVSGRACLIIDDMISTGGTISGAIEALLREGARPEIFVAATHGLLLPGAREKLSQPAVRGVFVTDTVPVSDESFPNLRIVSIASLLAGALERFLADGSIGDLF